MGENGQEITPKEGFSEYGVVKNEYIFIKGSIPGVRKRLIMLRSAIRPSKETNTPVEIKKVSSE